MTSKAAWYADPHRTHSKLAYSTMPKEMALRSDSGRPALSIGITDAMDGGCLRADSLRMPLRIIVVYMTAQDAREPSVVARAQPKVPSFIPA